jgi:hypothetical protein
LATDLTNKIEEEEDQAAESDYDDEDGEDDWEDEDDGKGKGKFSMMSDMLDRLDFDEDEEDVVDPDILADPVYQMNMKDYLVEFFRECVKQNSPAFAQSVSELSDVEKSTLSNLLGN